MADSNLSRRWQDLMAQHKGKLWLSQAVGLLLLGFIVAWLLRSPATLESNAGGDGTEAEAAVAAGEEEATVWTCSMHPQIRQPNPGLCPICAMDLIPVAKTSGGLRTLSLSPEAKALMNIETAPVERRYVQHAIRMVGKVDFDETRLGYITAWVAGRLDRLYVDFTGVEVKQGDHMVYIYSEELYSAQEELIQALKFAAERPPGTNRLGITDIDLVEASREKLRLLGLTEQQIKDVEKRQSPLDHVTIYSPVSGIVIEKSKQEGERVRLGDRIYTVADLRQVWVHLDAYEADLPWVRYGQDVTITTEAYPGDEFHGRIAFIQPVLNDRTRTVKVRVNVPNADGKLKPEMFVHATVRPYVAAGGRVLDPDLAGKWISPMHPEIVKDGPGTCDICGMPLVRAESLGYVAAEADPQKTPLVIPHLAALVTGTRAIVYVQLPEMHSAAEPSFQTLSSVVDEGKLEKTVGAFGKYARMLDRPYDQPGTDYARQLWNGYADRLSQIALEGQRCRSGREAEQVFGRIEAVMNQAREQFAPAGQPTFEGREIVLGPRADAYYLVRNGLEAGELVVTQGNFKIDSEIQLQAKPSMMTPEGGEHAEHNTGLPVDTYAQLRELEAGYDQVTQAIGQGDPSAASAAFAQMGEAADAVDLALLTGHPRTQWKELHMLISNDSVEGREATQLGDLDRVFLLLKGHMRRMREQLGVAEQPQRKVEVVEDSPEFQAALAGVWHAYLEVHKALAGDDLAAANQALPRFDPALAATDSVSLEGHAQHVWAKERKNLDKLLASANAAEDIESLRTAFKPLSEEIGVLAKTFGFGASETVFELHCPMAFDGQGATWYQNHDATQNPYYGSTMLSCADRVEQVLREKE